MASSIGRCGASTVRSCGPHVQLPVRQKKPHDEPDDHALGYSRGGFSTKIHLLTDANGIPLHAELSDGSRHEARYFGCVLDGAGIRQPSGQLRRRPARIAGDRAYSSKTNRALARARRIGTVIPSRKNEKTQCKLDQQAYRRRNAIERCVGWLKGFRRVGTRHEKLARTYLGILTLAMMIIMLRFSDRT